MRPCHWLAPYGAAPNADGGAVLLRAAAAPRRVRLRPAAPTHRWTQNLVAAAPRVASVYSVSWGWSEQVRVLGICEPQEQVVTDADHLTDQACSK